MNLHLEFLEHLLETVQVPLFILTMSRPEIQQRRQQWGTGRRATLLDRACYWRH